MPRVSYISPVVIIAALLMVSACAGPNAADVSGDKNAYVFNPNEFKRATFGNLAAKSDSITVCYNKYGTTPGTIANIAAKECAKTNKTAKFDRQSLLVCPLFTPVAAIYECIVDKR
jgi:hypothetical protein